jgi:Lecithin retinol acyltransferase
VWSWRPGWRGLQLKDRLLRRSDEPPLGSHLITPRIGFAHHGIYVGRGKVVHYGGHAHYLLRGPVEEISLATFANGHTLWIRSHTAPSRFDGGEVMYRARSRIGEDCYRLLSNNCEHFCEWCLHGEHRSYQVDRMLVVPRFLLRVLNAVFGRLLGSRGRDLSAC